MKTMLHRAFVFPLARPDGAFQLGQTRQKSIFPTLAMALFGLFIAAAGSAQEFSGWAELHAHPASHLAFGFQGGLGEVVADGIFHGYPGDDPFDRTAFIDEHLLACQPERHTRNEIFSIIQKRQRTAILSLLENRWGRHLENGAPDLGSWPHASSRTHQQMHLKWIRRAYEGGLRLMIASVTDSELLEKWWYDDGDNNCFDRFHPDRGNDFASAVEQIEFLTWWDDSTIGRADDWFDIVYEPSDVTAAWADNKLAILLGVEMDALSIEEIHELIDIHGVRSVIPVHLADNSIGGSAVYDSNFNILNEWLNRSHYQVVGDNTISTRLPRPETLVNEYIFPVGCSIQPKEVELGVWGELGYEDVPPLSGHRNARGLTDVNAIKSLMEKGVLIDIAHMSWLAADETIQLAEEFGYPLINSHTGLRAGCAGEIASERDLTNDHAARLGQLGGVIGLGTVGEPERKTLAFHYGTERLTGNARSFHTFTAPDVLRPPAIDVEKLFVRIATGDDDLRGSGGLCNASRARLILRTSSGRRSFVLNGADGFGSGSIHGELELDLVAAFGSPQALANLEGVTIRMRQGGGCIDSDNWDLEAFRIEYEGRETGGAQVRGVLMERSGAPYRRLTEPVPFYRSEHLRPSAPREERFRGARMERLDLTIETGSDDVRDGLELVMVLHDGRTLRRDFNALIGLPLPFRGSNLRGTGQWQLPRSVRYQDIAAIYIHNHSTSDASSYDNVDIVSARLEWTNRRGRRRTLVDRQTRELSGEALTWRLTRNRPDALLFQGLNPIVDPSELYTHIDVVVHTGKDDLRRGENASLVLNMSDGSMESFALNLGSLWDEDTRSEVVIPLARPLRASDIVSASLVARLGGGVSGDNWNVGSFVVSGLKDPAARWVFDFQEAYAAMSAYGGQPAIALGTDFNGLSPQMPYAENGQASALESLEFLPLPYRIAKNDRTLGREFTLERDGLAHFGMLPDFINHVQGFGDPRTDLLMRSAEATYLAWNRAVGLTETVQNNPPPELVRPRRVCLMP